MLDFTKMIILDGAMGTMLQKAGVTKNQLPEEVNIIGYNNSELAVCCEPELSSVDSRGEVLCKTAVDTMMTLLKGEHVKHKIVVPCRLVKRRSTNL